MAIIEAPFTQDGHMASYPDPGSGLVKYPWQTEMRKLPPFDATMRVIGMESGRSAKRLILEDQETKIQYPLFVADIVKLLQGFDIEATWEPCKRGQNYGLRVVK